MNLELLISKYLDGDLTPEEDQLLRKIISEEPLAREEFEGAALLHVEMQQDAESIVPPADLVSQTEDMILMKIMNHSVQDSGRPAFFLKLPFRRRLVNVFSVAVMLFAFTIPFRDAWIGEFADGRNSVSSANRVQTEINLELLQALSQGTPEQTNKNIGSGKAGRSFTRMNSMTFKNTSLKNAARENAGMIAAVADGNAVAEVLPQSEAAEPDAFIMEPAQPFTSLLPNRNYIGDRVLDVAAELSSDVAYAMPTIKSEQDEVQVSTFLATNVFKNSDKEKAAIASFSQSVSYGLSQNDRVGVELGYSSYMYEGNVIVSVSTPKGFIASKIQGAGDNLPPIPPDDGSKKSSNDLVWHQEEVAITEQVQMYWGAAFYERQLLRQGNGSIHSRIGAGGSGEGGIAYGRIFGRYDLFSVVSLTAGAESRAMVKAPVSVGKPEVNTSVSLMYGLQVRF